MNHHEIVSVKSRDKGTFKSLGFRFKSNKIGYRKLKGICFIYFLEQSIGVQEFDVFLHILFYLLVSLANLVSFRNFDNFLNTQKTPEVAVRGWAVWVEGMIVFSQGRKGR